MKNKKGNSSISIIILIGLGVVGFLFYTGVIPGLDRTSQVRNAQIKWALENTDWNESYAEEVVDGYIYVVKYLCNRSGGEIVFKNSNTFSLLNYMGDYTGPDIGCKVDEKTLRGEEVGEGYWSTLGELGYKNAVCLMEFMFLLIEKELDGQSSQELNLLDSISDSICSSEFKMEIKKELSRIDCYNKIFSFSEESECYSIDYSMCKGSEILKFGEPFTLQDCLFLFQESDSSPVNQPTTIYLSTQDKITGANINVDYFVFDSLGKFVISGKTSSGTATFSLNKGNNYDIITFSDNYYFEKIQIAPVSALNKGISLYKISSSEIIAVRDPIDLDNKISVGLGQSVNFDLLYSVSNSNSATNKPVIVIDVNQNSVQDVFLGGLSKVSCPTRLTVTSGRRLICFQDTTLKSNEGIRIRGGTIFFSSSVPPSTSDSLKAKVIDTQMYADPNWVITGIIAFKEGTENPNNLNNVGASDSNLMEVYYNG